MYQKLKYRELPDQIAMNIADSDFLSAYQNSDAANPIYIVKIVNRKTGRPLEREFDWNTKLELSYDDRTAKLPSVSTIQIPDLNAQVNLSFYLEPDTNIARELYEVVDLSSMKIVGTDTEAHYSTYKRSPTEIARSILKKYNFPNEYASWNNSQRINYWTEQLYRMRRQTSESGAPEDCAFDNDLAKQMLAIDPEIKKILPDCLLKLSQMEQVDHAALLSNFRKLTGMMV